MEHRNHSKPSNISSNVLLLIAAAALVIGVCSFAFAENVKQLIAILIGVITVEIAVTIIDNRLEKIRKEQKKDYEEKRVEELIKIVKCEIASQNSQNQNVKISGSSGKILGLIALVTALGLGYLFFSLPHPVPLSAYWLLILMLLSGFITLFSTIPYLWRNTLLQVSSLGLSSRAYGFIPWEDVKGIHIQKVTSRGMVRAHHLFFFIPNLAQYVGQFNSINKFFYSIRPSSAKNTIMFPLKRTNETPDIVYQLARRLWNARSGRDNTWFPGMSVKENAAWERLDEHGKNFHIPSVEEIRRRHRSYSTQLAKSIEKKSEETMSDIAIIKSELNKRERKYTIGIIIIILIAVIISFVSAYLKVFWK